MSTRGLRHYVCVDCSGEFSTPARDGPAPERCKPCRRKRRTEQATEAMRKRRKVEAERSLAAKAAGKTEAQRGRRHAQRVRLEAVEPTPVASPAVDLGHLVAWAEIAAEGRRMGRGEAEQIRHALHALRGCGLGFDDAWRVAVNGQESEVLEFARPAFERAYLGHPMTVLDKCARQLSVMLDAVIEDDAAPARYRRSDSMMTAA